AWVSVSLCLSRNLRESPWHWTREGKQEMCRRKLAMQAQIRQGLKAAVSSKKTVPNCQSGRKSHGHDQNCQIMVLRLRRRRGVHLLPDHHCPGANFPSFHQAVDHIGIVLGELFNQGTLRHVENEQCAIRGLTERAGQNQFTALMRLAGQAQMLVPILWPAVYVVINQVVSHDEV